MPKPSYTSHFFILLKRIDMIVFQNHQYRLSIDADSSILFFEWLEGHANMSYADFQEACSNYLGYGFEYQVKNFCIDVRNFQLQLPADFPRWQREEHYPRYYKLGIVKVAYLMPTAYLAEAKEIEKTPGRFALKNFDHLTSAIKWISEHQLSAA